MWVFFFFFLQVMLPSEIPKLSINQAVRNRFLLFGNYSSFTIPSPGWVSVYNSFVSLFVFYILSYLLSKIMGCLSGSLVSSKSIQKLFCGSRSAFKWYFDEFVGEKVVSLSHSSDVLGPPPTLYIVKPLKYSSPPKKYHFGNFQTLYKMTHIPYMRCD